MMTLTFRYPFIENDILKEQEGRKTYSNANNSRTELAELFRSCFTSLECEEKSSFWKGM